MEKHLKTLETLNEVRSSYKLKGSHVQIATHHFQWLLDQADHAAYYEETLSRITSIAANSIIK